MRQVNRPVLVLAATFLATGVFAGTLGKNDEVKLGTPTVVAGTVLPAGTYKIQLAPSLDAVSFVQGNRTLAIAACKVGLTPVVYPGNAVHTRSDGDGQVRLVKLVFAESKLAVEFPLEAPSSDNAAVVTAVDGH